MQTEIQCDVCVIGGGLAGIFAAIACKRTNPALEIWLIERYGFLGGMATAGYVFPFMGYTVRNPKTKKKERLTGGLFSEMLEKMHNAGYTEKIAIPSGAYRKYDPIMMRCVLDQMVLDSGIKVLFHALMNAATTTKQGSKLLIESVTIQTKQGQTIFHAKTFIDSSGDADLVFHAGGLWEQGRAEDKLVQPATLNFRIGNLPFWAANNHTIAKLINKEKATGNPLTPRNDCLAFQTNSIHERHFNQTRVAEFDPTDPFQLTQAEFEGRRQTERFFKFLKQRVRGFKHANMMNMGTQIGIRESRRIIAEYCLTEQDLLACKHFDDRIALGNYMIDIHDPKGSAKTQIQHIPPGQYYSIPYRSLIPKGMNNIIVAGRPIGTTHVSHSAIRIMPICSAIGHAAGIATALGLKHSQNMDYSQINIPELQAELRKQHAVLELAEE